MKPNAILFTIVLILASPCPLWANEILYETGFEAPAFTAGAPIRGQDGWEMFGDGEAISVSTHDARTGAQCLRFDGTLLEPQPHGRSVALCQLSPESLSDLVGGGTPLVVEIQCDIRLDGPPVGTAGTPDPDLISANLSAVVIDRGEFKNLGGFFVSAAGRIWTYSFAPGERHKHSAPYSPGTYRTLTLRVNFVTRTLTYLVDGMELGSSPFNPTNLADQLNRADLELNGLTDPLSTSEISYDPANYTAYYDNHRLTSIGYPGPAIVVEQPEGNRLNNGTSTVEFGNTLVGGSAQRTFTVRNPGETKLEGLAVTFDGEHTGDFALTVPPTATILPGGSSIFTVRFSPTVENARTATLHVTSNADNAASFGVALTGTGRLPTQMAQQAYLKASNTGGPSAGEFQGDTFGAAVALSGNTLVVGAPTEDSGAKGVNGSQIGNLAINSGAAYVFVREGTNWAQQAYLKASNTGGQLPGENPWEADSFGMAVAISGNTVVIGAPGEDSSATGIQGDGGNNDSPNSGAAYVFVREGTTWTQQAYLKASNSGPGDRFGEALAISGDTIAVGAGSEDSNAIGINGDQSNNSALDAGAAYVFVRHGTQWTQQSYLKPSNTGPGDNFGVSVAVSQDTIIVGAPAEDGGATGANGNQASNSAGDSGAAYVFVRDGTTWTQQAYLKASNTGAGDWFGVVAISGDTAAVGALFEASSARGVNGDQTDNSIIDGAGAAYVFVRNGTQWTQQAYLKASNTGRRTALNGAVYGDGFGVSLTIDGNVLVVGAPYESSGATGVNGSQANSGAHEGAGAAYVFAREGTEWAQRAYLKASNTQALDLFGGGNSIYGVALSGDTLVVGAQGESSNARGVNGNQTSNSASQSGAAYVFTGLALVMPEPYFLPPARGLDGALRLTIEVNAGRDYTLQASDDLRNWVDLVSQNAASNRLEFIDLPSTAISHRFYRVKAE